MSGILFVSTANADYNTNIRGGLTFDISKFPELNTDEVIAGTINSKRLIDAFANRKGLFAQRKWASLSVLDFFQKRDQFWFLLTSHTTRLSNFSDFLDDRYVKVNSLESVRVEGSVLQVEADQAAKAESTGFMKPSNFHINDRSWNSLDEEIDATIANAILALLPQAIDQFYMTLPPPVIRRSDSWDMQQYQKSPLHIYVVPWRPQRVVHSVCDAFVRFFHSPNLPSSYRAIYKYLDINKVAARTAAVFQNIERELGHWAGETMTGDMINLTPYSASALADLRSILSAGCSPGGFILPAKSYAPVEVDSTQVIVRNSPGSPVALSIDGNRQWDVTAVNADASTTILGALRDSRLYLGGTPTTYPMFIRVVGEQAGPPAPAPAPPRPAARAPFEIDLGTALSPKPAPSLTVLKPAAPPARPNGADQDCNWWYNGTLTDHGARDPVTHECNFAK